MCRTSRASHLKKSLFFLSTISALKPPAPPPCISAVTAPDSSRLHTTRQRRRSLPSDTNPNHNPHATRHSTHLQIMTALSGSSPLASKLHSTLAYLPRDETHHTCARTWHGHGGDAQRVRRALAPPLLQQHVSDVAQPQQLGERGVVHAAAEQQAAVTQLICDAACRVLRFLREVWGAAGGDARHGAGTARYLVRRPEVDEEVEQAVHQRPLRRTVVAVQRVPARGKGGGLHAGTRWQGRAHRVRWLRRMEGMRPPSMQCSKKNDLGAHALNRKGKSGSKDIKRRSHTRLFHVCRNTCIFSACDWASEKGRRRVRTSVRVCVWMGGGGGGGGWVAQ